MGYLSGAGLPRLSWKKGYYMDVVVVVLAWTADYMWSVYRICSHVADEVSSSNEGEHTTCRDEKKIVEELCETFTPKMAHMVYIAFLHLVGRSFFHIVWCVYCHVFQWKWEAQWVRRLDLCCHIRVICWSGVRGKINRTA